MNPGPGFRIRTDFVRLEAIVYRQLARFETPDISDMLNRLYAVDSNIRSLASTNHRIYGPVCTVKVFPGDNLMVHKVLDIAKPGDIVAIDAGGSHMNAVLGDIICTKARHRGIQGFIVDGLIRDLPQIQELDFPVFARGETAIGPLHRGPGEINFPIALGGIVVNPGDVIVADAAGIVAAPQDIVAELIRRLKVHEAGSREYIEAVQRGEFSNAWVDELLAEQNCVIETPEVDPLPSVLKDSVTLPGPIESEEHA
ncbi:4-hydroxy-4-methyl-2-oxoglutarate aldolase [Bremerella volcania]|uniref:Putative 4-hydroxy-4-methyl-2-oxoglutarate aldolase n=1 Tax=Bremerella volcania TaxID=2527984 RepID=A0A518C943_9BACT|nr:4-hydroxy-4-methyl-2-oxoglutarate aldolase [Bremerella volcania]